MTTKTPLSVYLDPELMRALAAYADRRDKSRSLIAEAAIASFLYTMTEPLLRPIRRFMPNTGGLDLSFLVLWFGIILLQQIIIRYIFPYVF